ncbi:uncharacterized protein CXQ87_001431 [Candidozyma duobushaemuli]|uniref:SRP54-type proteins GTP-binding domain-containing protein n=2 Tax=Candidozyma TaxID=3303203 RepID=A0ABX8I758_9ASCO|nr:uncharacterized protein CXQ87_001431 [[Candida] duobushaemulonis]PVH18501.1 hypothetical protein CXQ87_001431 [[Candida] duobushaemulonis]QWU87028.1 hypothetical protein CA3LBN_001246 [[Candida] haemuloni]
MSQSLIVFEPSGKVLHQVNNKISPFNDLIYSIVNDSHTELNPGFYTTSASQKRFYALKKAGIYAAVYLDVVTTLDSDKVRQCLSDVLRTYTVVTEEGETDSSKLTKLIDYQFNQLTKLKTGAGVTEKAPVAEKPTKPEPKEKTKKKGAKTMRKWVNGEMVEVQENSILDYSEGKGDSTDAFSGAEEAISVDNSNFQRRDDLVLVSELQDILGEESDEDEDAPKTMTSTFFGKVSSYFGGAADINDVSKKFYDQLISKNIAPPTASAILDKIKANIGKKSVTVAEFKSVLTEELTKTLTPNVSTDLLYDIKRNSAGKKRPYVISVVGVNGVGKSTNLAKLAYWFLQNNLNVLICACDTFRSGAVEQLKVHVNNLQRLNANSATESKIDLFEKGYGGGDHVVNTAKSAINHAQEEGYDIVLIDTAGRTHSNAKLMAPLKKFGDAANPDKIIMVGEALVGTDSVEQAVNFNNAFGNRRNLDFFIISKVDTVGDLVGSMINMVMATRVPILFVGTGQTYTDIKKLSVKSVVDMLTR